MEQYRTLTIQYKALANEKRLHILKVLKTHGMLFVGEIAEAIHLKIDSTSKHLRKMENAKLIVRRKRGLYVKYRLPLKKDPLLQNVLRNL